MRKFCQEQEINGIDIPIDSELQRYLPNRQSSDTQSVTAKCISDEQVSRLLEIAHVPLANITTFAVHSKHESLVTLLPPFEEKVFESANTKQVSSSYL